MADILIKNLEMPKEGNYYLAVSCDGKIKRLDNISEGFRDTDATAFALPEHGRLVSDKDVKNLLNSGLSLDSNADIDYVCGLIDGLPTIVEATE